MCRAVLCCAVLCCAVLCCAVLCCAVLSHACAALPCHALPCSALPCTAVLDCGAMYGGNLHEAAGTSARGGGNWSSDIRLLALDMDGTLLDSNSKVLPSSIKAIKVALLTMAVCGLCVCTMCWRRLLLPVGVDMDTLLPVSFMGTSAYSLLCVQSACVCTCSLV